MKRKKYLCLLLSLKAIWNKDSISWWFTKIEIDLVKQKEWENWGRWEIEPVCVLCFAIY